MPVAEPFCIGGRPTYIRSEVEFHFWSSVLNGCLRLAFLLSIFDVVSSMQSNRVKVCVIHYVVALRIEKLVEGAIYTGKVVASEKIEGRAAGPASF